MAEKKKSNKVLIVIVAILAVAIIAGVGYLVYTGAGVQYSKAVDMIEEGNFKDGYDKLIEIAEGETITPELKTEILNLVSNMILDSYYKYYFKEKLPEYITQISLEEIARLTKEFNQIFIDRLNEKKSNRRKK